MFARKSNKFSQYIEDISMNNQYLIVTAKIISSFWKNSITYPFSLSEI